MDNFNYKISIIIPVYNSAKYLPKCLTSVINQTYKNLEIIIIDDGSTDNSGKIADEFAKNDKRIIVIHKKNEGVAAARNTGLNISTGNFIGFVDNDDYIENDMYEILLKNLIEYNADIASCSYFKVDEDSNVYYKKYSSKVECYDALKALEELIKKQKIDGFVWNKIYKKDLIKNNLFNNKFLTSDDMDFNYKVFPKAKRILYIDIPKYYYLKHKESQTGKMVNYKNLEIINVYIERLEFISTNFPQLFYLAQKKLYDLLLKTYFKILINKKILGENNNNRNKIINYIKSNSNSINLNPLISRKNKFLLKLLLINFNLNFYLFFYTFFSFKKLKKRIIKKIKKSLNI